MRESAALARRLGLQLHTHLAETVEEEAYCRELYGCTPVEYLERARLARRRRLVRALRPPRPARGRRASAAHGVGVAHCPSSNLRLGAGVAPVRELLDAGVRVGLGVDGSASNERGDLFLEVKQALLVARGRGGPTALSAREALRLGTRGGAAVLRRDDIGSLEAGKRADFAVWRTDGLELGGRGRRPGLGPRLLGARTGSTGSSSAARTSCAAARSSTPTSRRSRASTANRRRGSSPERVTLDPRPRHRGRPPGTRRARRAVPRPTRSSPRARPTRTAASGRLPRSSSAARTASSSTRPRRSSAASSSSSSSDEGHYHVPLLVSPYGCASYRGS